MGCETYSDRVHSLATRGKWLAEGERGKGKVVREEFGERCPGRLGVVGGGGGQGRGPMRPGVEVASGDSIASNDINAGFAINAVKASSDCIGSVAPVDGLAGRHWRVWGSAGEPALRGCRGALRLRVVRGRGRAAGGVARGGLLTAWRGCWGWQPPSSPDQVRGRLQPSPSGRPLRNPRLGARKTPHRIRPKTAESASPLGEGEERRPLNKSTPNAVALRRDGSKSNRSLEDEGRYAKVSSRAKE